MAYKVFTNGSPLPASDLNTYLMNQSVMVFANSTARSAALTSPTEGMTTYLEDTNKVEVWTGAAWTDINDNSAAIPKSTVTTAGDLIVADGNASVTRLGIGTNGQVLQSNGTTATWVTPTSSAGWTLLSTTSMVGSSPLDITSISQSYTNLRIVVENQQSATANIHGFALRSSATNITKWDIRSNTSGSFTSSTSSLMYIFDATNLDANTAANYLIDIHNYSSTTETKSFIAYGSADSTSQSGWIILGSTRSNDAVVGMRFQTSAGFSAGTVKIYGGN